MRTRLIRLLSLLAILLPMLGCNRNAENPYQRDYAMIMTTYQESAWSAVTNESLWKYLDIDRPALQPADTNAQLIVTRGNWTGNMFSHMDVYVPLTKCESNRYTHCLVTYEIARYQIQGINPVTINPNWITMEIDLSQQSVPGYPPQGVGSPEP